jgi:hypothetical protein
MYMWSLFWSGLAKSGLAKMPNAKGVTRLLGLFVIGAVASACLSTSAFAQVGPPTPRAIANPSASAGAQVNAVKSSISNWLMGKKPVPAKSTVAGPNAINPSFAKAAVKLPAAPAAKAPMAPERPPLLSVPEPAALTVEAPRVSKTNPPAKLPALDNPGNTLGLVDPQNKLTLVAAAIDKKDYGTAKTMLPPLRVWLVETTEAHINLYKALDNVATARTQAELEKQLALQFAMMRDKALYQSARIAIADKDYRSAVKDLVEVIKSQPRSDLGLKAYTLLQEIGFTEKLQIAE